MRRFRNEGDAGTCWRPYISAMRLHILVAASLALPSFAASVTVGCLGGTPGDYPTISAAVAALDLDGPHTITVSGTCTENVLLRARERITLQGPATVIGAGTLPAIRIAGGTDITLRNLTVRAFSSAIQVFANADLTVTGVIAENSNFAFDAFGGASVTLGGANASDAVTLRNSVFGMRCESCIAFFAGWVTIENNTGNGLIIEGGRVETLGQRPASPSGPVQGGPTIIRNNSANGVNVSNRGVFETGRLNYIQNNGLSGIILNGGSANLVASSLPDGTPMGTIVENNTRNAVSALFNGNFSATGPNVLRNNGTLSEPFHCAVSAAYSSTVFITGGEVTGSVGPGIMADSLSVVRLNNANVHDNSEEGVRLLHGSLFESIGGNTIPATSVTCDGTSIVFGDFTGVAAFQCEKATKK